MQLLFRPELIPLLISSKDAQKEQGHQLSLIFLCSLNHLSY